MRPYVKARSMSQRKRTVHLALRKTSVLISLQKLYLSQKAAARGRAANPESRAKMFLAQRLWWCAFRTKAVRDHSLHSPTALRAEGTPESNLVTPTKLKHKPSSTPARICALGSTGEKGTQARIAQFPPPRPKSASLLPTPCPPRSTIRAMPTFHGGDGRSRNARNLGHERAKPDHEQLGFRLGHCRPLLEVGARAEHSGNGARKHHGSDGLVSRKASDGLL